MNYYLHGREGNDNPLQYSCLENPLDRDAWWAAVRGVAQSQTQLKWLSMRACIGEGNGNPLQCSCLENPRAGEPGGLPSMGSHRVGHDWSDLAAAADTVLTVIFSIPQQKLHEIGNSMQINEWRNWGLNELSNFQQLNRVRMWTTISFQMLRLPQRKVLLDNRAS